MVFLFKLFKTKTISPPVHAVQDTVPRPSVYAVQGTVHGSTIHSVQDTVPCHSVYAVEDAVTRPFYAVQDTVHRPVHAVQDTVPVLLFMLFKTVHRPVHAVQDTLTRPPVQDSVAHSPLHVVQKRSLFGGSSVLHFPHVCLLYTSPSPRDSGISRMPSSA